MLLIATLASLSSCGGKTPTHGNNTPSQTTDAGTTSAELSEYDKYPLPDKKMDGFELRFYNYNNNWLSWAINELDAE